MSVYTGRPIFCLERGAAHGFQRYQMDCTLAHFDEDATIEHLRMPATYVCRCFAQLNNGVEQMTARLGHARYEHRLITQGRKQSIYFYMSRQKF